MKHIIHTLTHEGAVPLPPQTYSWTLPSAAEIVLTHRRIKKIIIILPLTIFVKNFRVLRQIYAYFFFCTPDSICPPGPRLTYEQKSKLILNSMRANKFG